MPNDGDMHQPLQRRVYLVHNMYEYIKLYKKIWNIFHGLMYVRGAQTVPPGEDRNLDFEVTPWDRLSETK